MTRNQMPAGYLGRTSGLLGLSLGSVLLILLMAPACGHRQQQMADRFANVRVGMTNAEVEKTMGSPPAEKENYQGKALTGESELGFDESWTYVQHAAKGPADYFTVYFTDGKALKKETGQR